MLGRLSFLALLCFIGPWASHVFSHPAGTGTTEPNLLAAANDSVDCLTQCNTDCNIANPGECQFVADSIPVNCETKKKECQSMCESYCICQERCTCTEGTACDGSCSLACDKIKAAAMPAPTTPKPEGQTNATDASGSTVAATTAESDNANNTFPVHYHGDESTTNQAP